jgi:hypothetical protein
LVKSIADADKITVWRIGLEQQPPWGEPAETRTDPWFSPDYPVNT